MSQLQQSANRRGLAYRCVHCLKAGEAEPYMGERYRVVGHVYKLHIPFDRAPYSCTACLFRFSTLAEFERHLTGYTWHRQRADVDGDYFHKSQNQITAVDIEPLSKEESVRFFMDRSRRGQRGSPTDVEGFFTALRADLAGDNINSIMTSTDTEMTDLEMDAAVVSIISVTPPLSRSPSLPIPAVVSMSKAEQGPPCPLLEPRPTHCPLTTQVEADNEEALNIRVVKVRDEGLAVDILEDGNTSLCQVMDEHYQPRKRARSESSSSSSSSSTSSMSSKPSDATITKNLTAALGNLVKKATTLVTESVDKTMTMMGQLQKAIQQQAAEIRMLREVLAHGPEGRATSTRTRQENQLDPRRNSREGRDGTHDRRQDRNRDKRARSLERRRRSLERRRGSLERRENNAIADRNQPTEAREGRERWDNRRSERKLEKRI